MKSLCVGGGIFYFHLKRKIKTMRNEKDEKRDKNGNNRRRKREEFRR